MAHATRLLLVEELARKSRCVWELRDAAGLDISTVSKHLSLLRNAGILADEKRGLKVFYSLKTPCVLNFFKCVGSRDVRDRSLIMKQLLILGAGCAKCSKLYEATQQAAKELRVPCEINKVTDLKQIMALQVMVSSALVVDG